MKYARLCVSLGVWCMCVITLTVVLCADTLILRDGRRVQGELIAVRDGVIEFEGPRGGSFGGRELIRVDREDVRSIELDTRERSDRGRNSYGGSGSGFGLGGGRPSGLREREVGVDSWVAWKDTGIELRAGQTIYVSATGRVRWRPGRNDGPAGESNSPNNPGRPIPGRPAAALIGRVGDSNDYFFIGDDSGPIRVRSSGLLYLGVNDDDLTNNTGSFRVTVYY